MVTYKSLNKVLNTNFCNYTGLSTGIEIIILLIVKKNIISLVYDFCIDVKIFKLSNELELENNLDKKLMEQIRGKIYRK